jgi:hypothetical protein
MKNIQSIKQFQEQGTLRLVILSLLTSGVYIAHYIKRQTFKINQLVDKENNISEVFVNLVFVVSYGSLIALIGSLLADKGHPIEDLSTLLELISVIMVTIWTFKAGSRLNAHYQILSSDIMSFDRCWTFAFNIFYFNYNINSICEYGIE